jgi:hypothetical protein
MKVLLKVAPGASLARLSDEVFAAGGHVLQGYPPTLLIAELSSSATLAYGTQIQANVNARRPAGADRRSCACAPDAASGAGTAGVA